MRKAGGTYVAGIPTRSTGEVAALAGRIWPWVEPARNAWETLLLNFNAIDHVATVVTNLGSVENRTDVMLLWGEGASPGVARVIGAVDEEYAHLRDALGLPTQLRYEDFLVAQGLIDRKRETIHQTINNSLLAEARFQCGPGALDHRFISEDVPFSLVLASSIAAELGEAVPVIDGLISIATAASGRDYRAEGRTLSDWGLSGRGRSGLLAAVDEGWW
jgi:opine dehydrogenase